jgi:hypothetical protein
VNSCHSQNLAVRPGSGSTYRGLGAKKQQQTKHKAMLSAALTVVDNHASLTLPGALGSKVYDQVTPANSNQTKRRIAATASTTQQELIISHQFTGGSGFHQRIRSMIRADYRDLTKDTSLTDGVVPSCSSYHIFDRPVQSASAITDVIMTNTIAVVMDVILTSGALAKLLNLEG